MKSLKDEQTNIIKMYQTGMSIRKIAEDYKVSKNTIGAIIKDSVGIKKRGLSEADGQKALQLYRSGLNINEVSKTLCVNYSTVSRYLKNKGAESIPTKKLKYEHLLPVFVEQYESGFSLSRIADINDVSIQTVSNYLNLADVKLRNYSTSSRKYFVDDSFFSIPNKYNMYVLGKFFAYTNAAELFKSWVIRLVKSEKYISRILDVASYVTNKRSYTTNEQELIVTLTIHSKKIYDDFILYGVNKDDELNIPDAYINEFVLGYIEENIRFGITKVYVITGNDPRIARVIDNWMSEIGISDTYIDSSNAVYISKQKYYLKFLKKYPQFLQALRFSSDDVKIWWSNKLK